MRLSASKLSTFRDCPRCFWFQENKKTSRPRGIFPSLPGGVDRVIKAVFDQVRADGTVPAEIERAMPGFKLFSDQVVLDKMRNWRSGLTCKPVHGVELIGALDDLLVSTDAPAYAPLDYKSKGSPPTQADSEKYYEPQMDVYALLLEANGYRLSGTAALLYFWPTVFTYEDNFLQFDQAIITLKVDPSRAVAVIKQAVECLGAVAPPQASCTCEHCAYVRARGGA